MPRPNRNYEKSKDFFGSMTRLIKILNPWKYLLITCLLLALISAVLAIVTPKQLTKITDTIKDGFSPNTEKISLIISKSTEKMVSNLSNPEVINTLTDYEKEELSKLNNNYQNIINLDESL